MLIFLDFNLDAQDVHTDNSDFFHEIFPIYNFKQGVVSLTFDDGTQNHFIVALPLLKERNLPATFYLITNEVDSAKKEMISRNISGNVELGSHTASHSDLIKIGENKSAEELLISKLFLKAHFGENSGLTMSYPWGIYNTSVKQIAGEHYLAARSANIGYNSMDFPDKYALRIQEFSELTEVSQANHWVDFAVRKHLWAIEMIHGIDNIGYSPLSSAILVEHLDYIKESEDKIWCANVSDVIKYILESENAIVECDICTDTVFKIRVNDFMDDSIYDQPLSIKVKIPSNWNNIWVSNAEIIRTEYWNNNKFILFNKLPDDKIITIRPELISAPETASGIRLVYLSPNPFLDDIKLSLEFFDKTEIFIVLSDMNGKIIVSRNEKNLYGVVNLFFNTAGLPGGVYMLTVRTSSGEYFSRRLMKV